MKTHLSLLPFALTALFAAPLAAQPMQYPETRKDPAVTDNYHGTKVADPYRWLEDDRSTETADWVKRQNEVTNAYLKNIPMREPIFNRLEELYNYERYSLPQKAGEYVFFYKNSGLQNQPVLYRQRGMDGKPEVFLDPNQLSAEGTTTANLLDFSQDDKLVSFAIQKAGSDWQDIQIYDVASGKPLPDEVKWVKFSGTAWSGNGFYYSRYDEPKGSALSQKNEYQKVYYHKMGTPQNADEIVYADAKNPQLYYGTGITEDGRFLSLNISKGTSGDELHIRDLKAGQKSFKKLCPGFTNDYSMVENVGDRILVYTNAAAPNYRLVSIDPKDPAQAKWRDVLPAGNDLLQSARVLGGKLVALYLKDVTSRLRIYSLAGKFEREVQLPALGTVGGIEGKKDDKTAFFSFSSFTFPTTLYQLDIATGETKLFRKPEYPVNLTEYVVDQEFFNSKDGTKVPMFLIYKKGLEMEAKNPTLLYGYGGFNISITPGFNPGYLPLLERGGVLAMVNLRGGGEYGEKWHKAGMLAKKQNVFDDFIGAAEHLIKMRYTSPEYLAIEGGSNGGLLVGACMTQRPDLFKVAFPRVGVLDMLRFHKFTVGWGWVVEYGSADSTKHFPNLYKYSPLHNLKPAAYPATLVTTADHDDRVVPAHSFKFISALQAVQQGNNPTLIRIDVNAGHGAGKPIRKSLEERADILAFMLYNMGQRE